MASWLACVAHGITLGLLNSRRVCYCYVLLPARTLIGPIYRNGGKLVEVGGLKEDRTGYNIV